MYNAGVQLTVTGGGGAEGAWSPHFLQWGDIVVAPSNHWWMVPLPPADIGCCEVTTPFINFRTCTKHAVYTNLAQYVKKRK